MVVIVVVVVVVVRRGEVVAFIRMGRNGWIRPNDNSKQF